MKDINNTYTNSSNPSGFVTIGNTLFYYANDGIHGEELWKTDGTDKGTFLVKDINPGRRSSRILPNCATNVNGILYFWAYDGSSSNALWKSDGTEAGTVLIKKLRAPDNSYPYYFNYFTSIDNHIYFGASDGKNGFELWKSDGTSEGTILLKDINPGEGSSYPQNIINANGTLFFITGSTLWRSDGTTQGTFPVKTFSTNLNNLAYLKGTIYFVASNGEFGDELWKSNGTDVGTMMIKDINPGMEGSSISEMVDLNGVLYFKAKHANYGYELWKSDGTLEGTSIVKDIIGGMGSANPSYLTKVNDNLFFRADNGINGNELWKSDGTQAGTILVKDIEVGTDGSAGKYFNTLINLNGTLIFTADTKLNGRELWKSDGTEAGTTIIKDIHAGSAVSSLQFFNVTNGILYFDAYDGIVNGKELWKTDGTEVGTTIVKDINTTYSWAEVSNLKAVGGELFFSAYNIVSGKQTLWKSNGTESGTSMVKEFEAGFYNMYNFINVKGVLYFTASAINNNIATIQIWKSDGTPSGTVLVRSFDVGYSDGNLFNLTDVNGTLFFIRYNRADGYNNRYELWKSNGTWASTIRLKDFVREYNYTNSFPNFLINLNNTLYFSAFDGLQAGGELWKSDGTIEGTIMVKDIYPGSGGSIPFYLTTMNNSLYFTAMNDSYGDELWKSDGTEAGTQVVKDIVQGVGGSYAYNLIGVNHSLFFTAQTEATGNELWKSDGTAAGTMMVKDIYPGVKDSFQKNAFGKPNAITQVEEIIYFVADNGLNGRELWKSDGTVEGTMMVKDIIPGINSSSPDLLTNVNGTLFFIANDGMNGTELWKSDGTELGTERITNIAADTSSAFPHQLTAITSSVYFTTSDALHLNKIWKYETPDCINKMVEIIGDTVCADEKIAYISIIDSEAQVQYQAYYNQKPVSEVVEGGKEMMLSVFISLLDSAQNEIVVKATKSFCPSVELDKKAFIFVISNPDKPLITTIGTDTSAIFTLVSSSPSNNQWLLNGEEILAATQQSYQVKEAGTYSVRVTKNDCFTISEPIVLTGINYRAEHRQVLKIYPNPTSNTISLTYTATKLNSTIKASIYNAQGMLIWHGVERNQSGIYKEMFDVSHYPKGLYMIVIEDGSNQTSTRFIKE